VPSGMNPAAAKLSGISELVEIGRLKEDRVGYRHITTDMAPGTAGRQYRLAQWGDIG
jgi:hypothetical protein